MNFASDFVLDAASDEGEVVDESALLTVPAAGAPPPLLAAAPGSDDAPAVARSSGNGFFAGRGWLGRGSDSGAGSAAAASVAGAGAALSPALLGPLPAFPTSATAPEAPVLPPPLPAVPLPTASLPPPPPPPQLLPAAAAAASRPAMPASRMWRRRVDTNIVNVDLASLGQETAVATGDAQLCSGCGACLNAFSNLQPAEEDGSYRWTCEFCAQNNALILDEMEKPEAGQKSVDFVLEAPPAAAAAADSAAAAAAAAAGGGTAVVFCVDTSGSMCSTTAVAGRLSLRGDRTGNLAALRGAGDASDQRWRGAPRNVTYVSRMQAVQAAVDAELERLEREAPATRVGLVTFAGDVSLVGDAGADLRVIAGTRLDSLEAMSAAGAAFPLTRPISQSRASLSERLFALEEGGATALGPGVAAALSMLTSLGPDANGCSNGITSGRLVVCTDGLANVGIGALDNDAAVLVPPPLPLPAQAPAASSAAGPAVNAEGEGASAVPVPAVSADSGASTAGDEEAGPAALYRQLGRLAAQRGIAIDVVTVAAEGCDVESIGAMPELSGGAVTRVDPLALATSYSGMVAVPLLATNVRITMLLHAGLRFRNTAQPTQQQGQSEQGAAGNRIERFVGNVTAETELSLEFEVRPPAPATGPSPTLAAAEQPAATAPAAVPETAPAAAAAAAPAAAPAAAAATPAAPSRLPFQVQIRYTRPDGTRVLRVVTDVREVTRDRSVAERHAKVSVVASHAVQQSSAMARDGAYLNSRVNMRAWNSLVARSAASADSADARREYANFQQDVARLDGALQQAQATESASGAAAGEYADEDPDNTSEQAVMAAAARSRFRRAARSRNDEFSSLTYSLQSKGSKGYRK